jgi:DNA gyrase/topoisomerase IV subunit A
MWTARNGNKDKSASLAGATMPIHPHAAPETTINTLAAPYGNNIPLLHGFGSFGTRLDPTGYGASRYTSVKASEFAKKVLYADLDIVPLQDNYDNTRKEPKHFLPIVPLMLLNPSDGIAVGFSCTILPRSLKDIIDAQIKHLDGKSFDEAPITFAPVDAESWEYELDELENKKWYFTGEFERTNTTTVVVTNLPYGKSHASFISNLNKLIDQKIVKDYIDDSVDSINITVKFERTVLNKYDDDQLCKLLKLSETVVERMNAIDFDGETIKNLTFETAVQSFTDWRLNFYKTRYEKLHDELTIQIQRYKDVITAINKNVGSKARSTKSKGELVTYLESIKIVHTDYISSLPVYRFTEEEKQKTQEKLDEAEKTLAKYAKIIKSKAEQKKIYISELQEIKRLFK